MYLSGMWLEYRVRSDFSDHSMIYLIFIGPNDRCLCRKHIAIKYLHNIMPTFKSLVRGICGYNFKDVIFEHMLLMLLFMHPSCEIYIVLMQKNAYDKSKLVPIMVWCHQATSHYLGQWWPSVPFFLAFHGPLARYVKLRIVHAPGMPGTFSPSSRVSNLDMHHGTYVMHVPWWMPGSLTTGFLWSRP